MTEPQEPTQGGGWPVVNYWVEHLVHPQGPALADKLLHAHACKSCAWGTKGFWDELGRPLQRCAKGVEAEVGDLQAGIPIAVFEGRTVADLAQLTSLECERLGRLSQPLRLTAGRDHYEPVDWETVYAAMTENLYRHPPHQAGSYSSGRGSNEAAFALQLFLRQ